MSERSVNILNCNQAYAVGLMVDGFSNNEIYFDCPLKGQVRVRQQGATCGNCVTGRKNGCESWASFVNNPSGELCENASGRRVVPQFKRQEKREAARKGEIPEVIRIEVDPGSCRNIPDIEIVWSLLKYALEFRGVSGIAEIEFDCPNKLTDRRQNSKADMAPISPVSKDLRKGCMRVECVETSCRFNLIKV